ncbi:MAG: hypothetical protein HFF42_09705 [Lawsonibacter sp.]|jgi:hypothetical protein|nr:hypothetical protein [Lawsonibacter sp.]
MNSEHLLDAIGLLDDGLIHEAEEYSRPRRDYRPWISLAASFVIVLTLGYALTHLNLGMGGGAAPENQASGGAANAPAGSYGGAEAPPPVSTEGPDGSGPQSGEGPGSPDAAAPQEPGAFGGSEVGSSEQGQQGIWVRGIYQTWTYYALSGDTIRELPPDSVPVGILSSLYPDAPSPYTDAEAYVGLELWCSPDGAYVYAALPDGGYAVGESVQL